MHSLQPPNLITISIKMNIKLYQCHVLVDEYSQPLLQFNIIKHCNTHGLVLHCNLVTQSLLAFQAMSFDRDIFRLRLLPEINSQLNSLWPITNSTLIARCTDNY